MERYSSVKVRETDTNALVRITSFLAPEIEENLMSRWQGWLNIVAQLAKIPAALIMKLNEDTIEVFLKSNTTGNPYKEKETAILGCGLFCENVIGTQRRLLISNAITNNVWKNNPDIDLNMISYLGFPLNWPNGEVFGTICILDEKENQFSKNLENLLFSLKQNVESDLELLLAKQSLSESEEKFRLLFNLLPLPAAFTDFSSGRIIDINNKLLELTGFSKDDLLQKSTVDLGLIEQSVRTEILADVLNKGQAEGIEVSFPSPLNGMMHFVLSSTKIELKGKEKLITVLQDITDNKKQLQILIESEKRMAELTATKNKFFSIISHDLMDPFNSLLGFSNLLTEALRNDQKKDSLEYTSYIQQAAQNIYNLLQDLLLWTRSQSGNINFNPALVNVSDLINKTINLLKANASNKNINIRVEIEKNLIFLLDFNIITTVVRNLVMNSIKFTDSGGQITIKAKSFNNGIKFTISDTGIGMDKMQLKNLFKLEKSYSSKGTNDESGTGLGLIICKEFISLHNGKIWAQSTYGKGSKFHFWIPERFTTEKDSLKTQKSSLRYI